MKRSLVLALLTILLSNFMSAQFQMQNPVTWTSEVVSKDKGEYELVFKATIKDPWHMYAIEQEQTGPIPTNFTFEENKDIELIGKVQELTKPKIKFDEGFRFDIGAYYEKAEFKQLVRVKPGKKVDLKVTVEYQCCDDESCLPPFTKEFNFNLNGSVSAVSPDAAKAETEKKTTSSSITADESTADEGSADEISGNQTEIFEESVEPGQASVAETESDLSVVPATESRSLAGFLILTFLLGFAAILTPCVYPMIPMTISFFMRETGSRTMVVIKGIVFGFAMILVYTGLGALVALTGMDANFGNIISTHWIPNLIFFLLFMIFAASFLGMFEFVLPSGIVNRVDKQADKGGLAGPFFMGITTVLVSFSCTGPIVGSLLTEAAGGDVMKPILGMFFFSLAFALPFTLLAIFPSMLKNLPKSGGWLNTIKVVLGFLMLAFGMKFLSAIDQSYHLDIFSREVYLAIWFVIAVITGFYLLGKIKFSHDSDLPYISVPRMLLSMVSFVFAIYIFTGILGNDLKAIGAMIPPKSSSDFSISGNSNTDLVNKSVSTYCGPGKYDELFELPYGLTGYFNYEDGIRCAREMNKPVFIDFTGHSCSNCKQMEAKVWSDPNVLKVLRDEYVVISLYTDDKTKLPEDEWVTAKDGKILKTIGEVNVNFEIENYKTFATPWYILADSDGRLLAQPMGKEMNIENFLAFLNSGIEKFSTTNH